MPTPIITGILTIKRGSSSLKFSLYQTVSLRLQCTGKVSNVGEEQANFEVSDEDHQRTENRPSPCQNLVIAAKGVIGWLESKQGLYSIAAIGHRLVRVEPDHREFLVIDMNAVPNRAGQEVISSKTSRVVIKMLKTDEERMIAQHIQKLLNTIQNGNGTR